MSSLADVLSSEVSTLVEAGCARMDNIFDISTVQANRNVLAEAEDHTKPYLHLCKTLSVLQEVRQLKGRSSPPLDQVF